MFEDATDSELANNTAAGKSDSDKSLAQACKINESPFLSTTGAVVFLKNPPHPNSNVVIDFWLVALHSPARQEIIDCLRRVGFLRPLHPGSAIGHKHISQDAFAAQNLRSVCIDPTGRHAMPTTINCNRKASIRMH